MTPARPAGSTDGAQTVLSYFAAFAPAPDWDELVRWPPDVFALANLVLDHTEGYRFVVAPPTGRCWPPLQDWGARMRLAAGGWREACGLRRGELPPLVRDAWRTVTRFRDVPLARVRSGDAWELTTSLLTLHALADEACAGVASGSPAADASFESLAWNLLQSQGSLSRLSPTRVRIVPKTNFSARGITIRSLSRYLALCYESVEVKWRSGEPEEWADRRDYNIVLVPWPLSVKAEDFRPRLRLSSRTWISGSSASSSSRPTPHSTAISWARCSRRRSSRRAVDAVILPEAAVRPETIDGLERTLAEHGATFLIAGVREPPAAASFGRNLWPSRYSGVLADDPGCAVLTLTSYGMAARCRPPGRRRSRVVAHWNSQADGPHEVELERGASGVLVSASVQESTLWRADGRCHRDVPQLRLSGVRQLRATRAGGRRQAVASR